MASGRNVCMYFLLGDCKFGSSACVYSHDKTYLPSGRWWDNEGKVALLRQISMGPRPKENSAFMPYMCGLADNRLAWASAHGIEMEEVYGHWRDQAQDGFCNAADDGLYATFRSAYKSSGRGYRGGRGRGRGRGRRPGGMRRGGWHSGLDLDDFEDSVEERMNNFGFTEDEVQELLCQGVKPWDDDAGVSTFGFGLLTLFCIFLILALGCARRTLLALTAKIDSMRFVSMRSQHASYSTVVLVLM